MTTLAVPAIPPVSAPRGAVWAGALFAPLFRALAGNPGGRAAPAADATAAAHEQKARRLDAMRVRAYADAIAAQDPRFAADLYAAADRHEH